MRGKGVGGFELPLPWDESIGSRSDIGRAPVPDTISNWRPGLHVMGTTPGSETLEHVGHRVEVIHLGCSALGSRRSELRPRVFALLATAAKALV